MGSALLSSCKGCAITLSSGKGAWLSVHFKYSKGKYYSVALERTWDIEME